MEVYKLKKGTEVPNRLSEVEFALESDLQRFVDSNLENFFGLKFIKDQFQFANGKHKIDTLAYNERENAFVIIEYKNDKDYYVLDQVRRYMFAMNNYKNDFVLEYNVKMAKQGVQKRKQEFNWDGSSALIIAPAFFETQIVATKNSTEEIYLCEFKKYKDNVISIDQKLSVPRYKLSADNKKAPFPPRGFTTASADALSYIDDSLDDPVKALWTHLKSRMSSYDGTEFADKKNYISWKVGDRAICYIYLKDSFIHIAILRGDVNPITNKHSRNFFSIDPTEDPEKMLEKDTKLWSVKGKHAYWIRFVDHNTTDYVIRLLEFRLSDLRTLKTQK